MEDPLLDVVAEHHDASERALLQLNVQTRGYDTSRIDHHHPWPARPSRPSPTPAVRLIRARKYVRMHAHTETEVHT